MNTGMKALLIASIIIAAIGAINWGLVGLFEFDLVAEVAGAADFGVTNTASRIIYGIVGLAGIISLAAIPYLAAARERYETTTDNDEAWRTREVEVAGRR